MSRIRGRFLKDKVTRWRQVASSDPYAITWGSPVTVSCAYINTGSVQKDDNGTDFMPASTYYCKAGDFVNGDRVALGEYSDAEPVEGSESVRKVKTKTPLVGSRDMTIYTG